MGDLGGHGEGDAWGNRGKRRMIACERTRNQIARLPLRRDAGRGKFPAPLILHPKSPIFGDGLENLDKDKRESKCSLGTGGLLLHAGCPLPPICGV